MMGGGGFGVELGWRFEKCWGWGAPWPASVRLGGGLKTRPAAEADTERAPRPSTPPHEVHNARGQQLRVVRREDIARQHVIVALVDVAEVQDLLHR